MMNMDNGLDKRGLPTREGVYQVRENPMFSMQTGDEIDVYDHPVKGLSCYSEDFGSAGTGVNDETDCHVSVGCTGLKFIKRVRDLD